MKREKTRYNLLFLRSRGIIVVPMENIVETSHDPTVTERDADDDDDIPSLTDSLD